MASSNSPAKAAKQFTVKELSERDMERWDSSELRELTDFETALKKVQETYGPVVKASETLGNGFALLSNQDKAKLAGKPFLLLFWTFNPGDFGDYFVSCAAMTSDGQKFILNDGSSGIYTQLREFSIEHDGRQGGLLVEGGLRMSQYATCSSCDRPRNKMQAVCTNLLGNGSQCGDKSEERHSGETAYLETARQPV